MDHRYIENGLKFTALIFDLFGTLTVGYSRYEYIGMLNEMARALGLPPDRFQKEWLKDFQHRVTGTYRESTENLYSIVQSLGIIPTYQKLQYAADIRRIAVMRALHPYAETINILIQLKNAGLSLGILSNCSSPIPDLLYHQRFARFVDAIILSSEVHLKKPDPKIYLMVSRCLGVNPETCIYVGDGGSQELTGATRVGMSAIKIVNSQFQIERDWFGGPSISSLTELPKVLGI